MSAEAAHGMLLAFFHEEPNEAAAAAALALYALITAAVAVVTHRTRARFMAIVVVTGLLEMAGFAMRILMLHKPSLAVYASSQFFLIVSPVLLAIADYMAVGRLLALSPAAGPDARLTRNYARVFTTSDIVTLVIQAAGGGMCSMNGLADTGRSIMLGGLVIQLGFFSAFTASLVAFHATPRYGLQLRELRPMLAALYATIALMFIRNIFRVVEFGQGFFGYLATHEAYFYGFDFAVLYACFICFTVWHYGRYLRDDLGARMRQAAGIATATPKPGVAALEVVTVHAGNA